MDMSQYWPYIAIQKNSQTEKREIDTMSKYRIENCIVDTDKATKFWKEDSNWDGSNWISAATGSQWEHQTLYRSRKGRYYIEHSSNWANRMSYAEWISPQEATRWLILMDYELPEELKEFEDTVTE